MVKNFTIAILVALFAYLLSAQNQLIGDYSIYVAIISAVLGWLTSFLSGKDAKVSHVSLVGLLESLNQLIDVQNQNTSETVAKVESLCDIEKENINTLSNQISALKDAQDKNSGNTISKVNEVINGMKDAVCKELQLSGEKTHTLIKNSFKSNTDIAENASQKQLAKLESLNKLSDALNRNLSETIGIINHLCEIEQDGINSLGIQMSALKDAQEKISGDTISNLKGMKEAICVELQQSGEKTNSIIKDTLYSNTANVETFLKKQSALSNQIEGYYSRFNSAVSSFCQTIEQYDNICDTIEQEISNIGAQAALLTETSIEQFKNATSDMMFTINSVKDNLLKATNEMLDTVHRSIDSNKTTTERMANDIQEKLKNTLTTFSETTKGQQESANEAIKNVCLEMASKQNTELQKIEKGVDNINFSIKDFCEATSDFKYSINESLRTIKNQLETSYEDINDQNKEQLRTSLSKIQEDINGTLNALSDDLTTIATMFTDYEEEKEIIQRLEKLCGN